MALIIEAVFGVVFGLIAGLRKGGFFDSTVLLFSLFSSPIPIFVIGFLAQFFIGVKWGIAPADRRWQRQLDRQSAAPRLRARFGRRSPTFCD